jgi:hypothetical protein
VVLADFKALKHIIVGLFLPSKHAVRVHDLIITEVQKQTRKKQGHTKEAKSGHAQITQQRAIVDGQDYPIGSLILLTTPKSDIFFVWTRSQALALAGCLGVVESLHALDLEAGRLSSGKADQRGVWWVCFCCGASA